MEGYAAEVLDLEDDLEEELSDGDRIAYVQMLKASLCLFGEDILGLEIGPHLIAWEDLVQKHNRIAINAARDHSKSCMFSYAYPIWRAWSDPGCEVYIFSKTLEQAMEFLDIIVYGRNNLKSIGDIPQLAHLLPTATTGRTRLKRSDLRLTNGSRIRAIGYGKAIRGAHPKYMVLDDPLNDEDMWSEIVRKKNIEYFKSAIVNMIMPGGQICCVGCVTEDTWVPTENGLQQIGTLRPGMKIPQILWDLSLKVKGFSKHNEATKFWDNGVCKTKRITLTSELSLEGSLKHPVWYMPETGIPRWKSLQDLKEGDWVGIQVGSEAWGKAPEGLDEDMAYLMGLWVAEGCTDQKRYQFIIANTDKEIHQFLLNRPESWKSRRGGTHWQLNSKELFVKWTSWGVTWATSHGKRIPKAIMEGCRENAVAWLQGYLDGDGNSYVKGSTFQVAAGTVSLELAKDVQMLLLNLGIRSNRFVKPYRPTKIAPRGSPLHMVRMLGDYAKELMRWGFRLTRKKHDLPLFNNGFRIPHQGKLIRAAMDSKPRRYSPPGTPWSQPPFNAGEAVKSKPLFSRVVLNIADWYESHGSNKEVCSQLRKNAVGNIHWEKIKAIKSSKSYTVDFVIPEGHAFVSNGIMSHNTPYHVLDLWGWLRKNPMYVFKKYPGIIKDPVTGEEKALFPWRYSLEDLHDRKKEIGPVAFAREILTEAITDDVAIFPSYLFPPLFADNLCLCPTPAELRGMSVYVGIDIARSASVGADYFVIFTIAVDELGNYRIVDIERFKGLAFNDQITKIKMSAARYRADLILIESNAMQQIWAGEIARTTDLPVREFVTTAQNKYPLDKGVPGIRILLENRKLIIPRGDEYSIRMTDKMVEEATQFGFIDGKLQGIGASDDIVMALWFATEAAKAGGFSFSMGGDEDNLKELEDEMSGGEGSWEEEMLGSDEDYEELEANF